MRGLFEDAVSFNEPLNNWDVSSVTETRDMFWYTPELCLGHGNPSNNKIFANPTEDEWGLCDGL